MNRIIRAFAAFIVSICLILAPAVSYAASSWNVTSVASAGGRVIVSATKAGYKSAINIAPTAGRLGSKLVKGANWASLLYAALQLAPELADIKSFQPQYAQNRVKYNTPSLRYTMDGLPTTYDSVSAACSIFIASRGYAPGWTCRLVGRDIHLIYPNTTTQSAGVYGSAVEAVTEAYIPISSLSSQVLKNAAAGHAPSQEAVTQAAIEMVATGDFDSDFLAGAVPTNDTKPLIPAVPGTQNGNQGYGGVSDAGDGGMNGASPGEQADAAKAAAEAAQKAAAAAKDAAKAATEQAARDAAAAQDLINSANDQAAIAAAEAKAAAATKAAADAKAVADAAVAAANDRASAAERAAEAATKSAADAATKAASDLAAAKAAGDAATKAASDLAAAKAAGDAAAIAAAEKAKAAADTAVAAAKEKQAAAEKAAEKAKAEAAKPFELPAFCTWASKVCDFVDWVKETPILPDVPDEKPEIQDIDKYDNIELNRGYITATGECPPSADLNINFGVVKLSYEPLCIILEKLSGVIVAVAYISAGFMIVRTV